MDSREVYSNPPVVLVAFELRHPGAEPLSASALAKLKALLANEVPLRRDATVVNVNLNVQPGQAGIPQVDSQTAPKFFSRDRTTAVTYRGDAIVVETTKYQQYERVRELVSLAVHARQAVSSIDGVDRIGLRYINEVRVPAYEVATSPTAWAAWLDDSLLGPLSLAEDLKLTPQQLQGLAQFEVSPGQTLALRYGPLDGYAVSPDGDLKRITTPPGPFFLLDIDSFWTATEENPQADPTWIMETCDSLHRPVGILFERLITDRLRGEIRHNAS